MTQREMIRLAQMLQHYWQLGGIRQHDAQAPLFSLLRSHLKRLRRAERTLNKARDYGLQLIESQLEEQVLFQARCLRITLQDQEGHHFPVRQVFPLRDFYQDLAQLEEEFAAVRVSWDDSLLIVETDNIVLEDIELGHFTIRFNWKQWAQEASLSAVQVIAEEPNTAELNGEVSHPHVRDGELCPGDANTALHKAFVEGRLAEAFLIIHAVLTNYNPKSAYVRLDEWHGVSCHECGRSANEEERHYCEGCHQDYCDDCISSCAFCSTCRCQTCMEKCFYCDDYCCRHCLETSQNEQQICRHCRKNCPGCQGIVGPNELDAAIGLCADCEVDSPELFSEELDHEAVSVSAP